MQSAGALSECSIRNDNNKRLISEHGAILPLVKMLRSQVCNMYIIVMCIYTRICIHVCMRGSKVIEETDARVNVVLAGSVNVDLARDARLLGLARHRRSVFRRHA